MFSSLAGCGFSKAQSHVTSQQARFNVSSAASDEQIAATNSACCLRCVAIDRSRRVGHEQQLERLRPRAAPLAATPRRPPADCSMSMK